MIITKHRSKIRADNNICIKDEGQRKPTLVSDLPSSHHSIPSPQYALGRTPHLSIRKEAKEGKEREKEEVEKKRENVREKRQQKMRRMKGKKGER